VAKTKPKPTIADILADARNPAYVRVATARVLLRQDLAARHEELDAELRAAIEVDHQEDSLEVTAPDVAEQVQELEAEIEAAKVSFRFRAIGKRAWSDLLKEHPPTKAQLQADPRLDHNPETFPAAAIAASCSDPEMTLDDARELEAALNQSQFAVLWAACIDANIGGVTDPKSRLAAGLIRRANGESAKPPTTTGSHEASSSDE